MFLTFIIGNTCIKVTEVCINPSINTLLDFEKDTWPKSSLKNSIVKNCLRGKCGPRELLKLGIIHFLKSRHGPRNRSIEIRAMHSDALEVTDNLIQGIFSNYAFRPTARVVLS